MEDFDDDLDQKRDDEDDRDEDEQELPPDGVKKKSLRQLAAEMGDLDVKQEKQDTENRVTAARDFVQKQVDMLKWTEDKMKECQDEGPPIPDGAASGSAGYLEGSEAGHGSGAGYSRHKREVAAGLARQMKLERFQMRKAEELAKAEEMKAKILEHHAAAEIFAKAQKDQLYETTRKRGTIAQMRRNEQQKVCREIQREQERRRRIAYAKIYGVAEEHGASPRRSPQSTPRSSCSSSGLKMKRSRSLPGGKDADGEGSESSWQQEEVFQHTLNSHRMFSGEVDRWKQFVAENERRTEAHWVKLLGPKGRAYADKLTGTTRRSVRDRMGSSKSQPGRFTSSHSEPKTAEASKDPRNTMGTSPLSSSSMARPEGKKEYTVAELDLMSDSELKELCRQHGFLHPHALERADFVKALLYPPRRQEGRVYGMTDYKMWQERSMKCKSYLVEQDGKRVQQWNELEARLNHARDNKERIDRGIMNKALGAAAEWNRRDQLAKQNRLAADNFSDASMVQKIADVEQRLQMMKDEAQNQRDRKAREEARIQQECYNQKMKMIDDDVQRFAEINERKDKQTVAHFDNQKLEMEQKLNPPGAKKHADIVKQVLERRAQHEADKVIKARKEVAAKEARFNASVAKMKTGLIEKQRAKLRLAKQAGQSKKNEGYGTDGDDDDREAGDDTPKGAASTETPAGSSSSATGTIDTRLPQPWSPKGRHDYLKSLSSWRPGDELPSDDEIDVLAKQVAAVTKSVPKMAYDGNDDSDDEEGKEILRDLETRSAKWLQEMRAQLDT